jgi:hypothetical protein
MFNSRATASSMRRIAINLKRLMTTDPPGGAPA